MGSFEKARLFKAFFNLGRIAEMTSLPSVKEHCELEMIGRSCKQIFNGRLRKKLLHFRDVEARHVDDELKEFTAKFVKGVFDPEKSRKVWN